MWSTPANVDGTVNDGQHLDVQGGMIRSQVRLRESIDVQSSVPGAKPTDLRSPRRRSVR